MAFLDVICKKNESIPRISEMGFGGLITGATTIIVLATTVLPQVSSIDYMPLSYLEQHLPHNPIFGSREINDISLLNQRISLTGIPSGNITVQLKYPLEKDIVKYRYPIEITYISVTGTSNRGHSSIIEGGVGYGTATFKLQSGIGESLECNIRIYGKRKRKY